MKQYRDSISISPSLETPELIDLHNRRVDQLKIYRPSGHSSDYISIHSSDYPKDYETTSRAQKKASKANRTNSSLLNTSEDTSTSRLLRMKAPESLQLDELS
ncbi:uncharacterized protein RSE6_02280 [Rhynchosporium secalis]|uniref:Uncharacterized protein n=1 Tax=Rhynchosporium secalis TaxID=38038 RepID=A0A1E1M1H2_RHYSE|nr:uncharacterized protein RSE6_02280 [Rhynchosporium secalis]